MPEKEQSASGKQSLCSRLGFKEEQLKPGIEFQLLGDFRELKTADSKYFPIGILSLPGKKVGTLRIPLFSSHPFPDLCESAASQLGLKQNDSCDEFCANRVAQRADDLFIAALERQVRALAGIDSLLVDITGNGGGSDCCEPFARILTSKHLRSPHMGFIRHELWIKYLNDRLAGIEEKSKEGHASPRQRELISQGTDTYRKALAEARLPVDRDMMWNDQQPDRSLVVKNLLFTSGTVPYLSAEELSRAPAMDELFFWSRYTYDEGVYSGPLMILVDDRTGSAAEQFVSVLTDNGAATIIGTPTAGAGFGYNSGGISTILKNSGGDVKMPDGVRYRSDGTNEVSGNEPDVLIPWRQNYSSYQKAKHVLDALIKLMKASPSRFENFGK